MSFVLDCSVTMAWCFDDERTTHTDALLEQLIASGAVAPSVWPLEVTNVLLGAARRGRIKANSVNTVAQRIRALPITVDEEGAARAWDTTLQLAERHNLTSYEASYLELAIRKSLPLATLDKVLRVAAKGCGVTVA